MFCFYGSLLLVVNILVLLVVLLQLCNSLGVLLDALYQAPVDKATPLLHFLAVHDLMQDTLAVHLVILPLSFVGASVSEVVHSVAASLVALPLPLVAVTVGVDEAALAVPFTGMAVGGLDHFIERVARQGPPFATR